jgi:hypothetical protein
MVDGRQLVQIKRCLTGQRTISIHKNLIHLFSKPEWMADKNTQTWVKDYIDAMLAENDEHAMALKLDNFPDSLFKYRKLNEYALESISNNEFYLSEIHELNDPFECAMLLDHVACSRLLYGSVIFQRNFKTKFGFEIPEEVANEIIASSNPNQAYRNFCASKGICFNDTLAEEEGRIMSRWEEIRTETNKNIRVTCFSERNDSILMWSHYADQHQGICLQYNFTDCEEIRYLIQPAYYSETVFQLSTMEDLNATSHIMSSLHKAKDWAYEKEWRLTGLPKDDGKVPAKIRAPKPIAIYLGARFHLNKPELRAELIRMAQVQSIPVIEMRLHGSQYQIVRKGS